MIQIKSGFTGEVIFEGKFGSIKLAVEAAVSSGAYLGGANLGGADLDGANLRGANLGEGCSYGEGVAITKEPLQIFGKRWPVYIFDTHIKIGCQIHETEKWKKFSDKSIDKMDSYALEFWN